MAPADGSVKANRAAKILGADREPPARSRHCRRRIDAPVFERSYVELETARGRWWLMLLAVAFLAAWAAWSCLARVEVYRTSTRARIERDAHTVEASVAGRVEQARVVVGQRVEQGEVLLELDASAERLERRHVEARLEATRADVERIEAQRLARLRIREQAERWSDAVARRERSRVDAAGHSARHSRARAQALERAAALDAVPHQAVEDALHEAQQERATQRSLALGLDVLDREAALAGSREDAELEQLRRELLGARGTLRILEVELQRIDGTLAAKRVVSPVAGEVIAVAPLLPGAYVESGAEVAVLVPRAEPRVVAWLPIEGTVGWVRPGQAARVRLYDFPWTRWGSVPATVDRISREPKDGLVRVDLRLDATRTEIPLDHGLPCSVEIGVDRVSPLELVLRAAGRRAGAGRRVGAGSAATREEGG